MKKHGFSIKSDNMEIIPVLGEHSPEGSDAPAKDAIWDADWKIIYHDPGEINSTEIGHIRFEGKPMLGKAVISFSVIERYRNMGYASRALKMMRDHLFWRGDIYEIEAKVTLENDPAIHALTRAGFVYRSAENNDGVKTETYSITKPKSAWSGLYLFIGLIAGLSLGILMANLLIGLATGVIAGLLTGALLDSRNQKKREDITGRKE